MKKKFFCVAASLIDFGFLKNKKQRKFVCPAGSVPAALLIDF
jgi:hypothetical protein